MVKMVPYEAFACRCGAGDVVLRESYKPKTRERVRLLVGSPGASTTPIYSPVSSSTTIYSPGSLTPPRYSPGASTPAQCSNCKHLLDKITILEATVDMYMHLRTLFPYFYRAKPRKKPKTQDLEASGLLPQKRKQYKPKKTPVVQPTETPPTEEVPTEDSGKSHSVDQTQSIGFEVSVPDQNQSNTSYEGELDSQSLILSTAADVQALMLSDDELIEESDDDVFEAGDEMDEDIHQANEEETQDTDASDSESSSCSETFMPYDNFVPVTKRKKHEEAAASYADLKWSLKDFIHASFNKYENNDTALRNFQPLVTLFKTIHNASRKAYFAPWYGFVHSFGRFEASVGQKFNYSVLLGNQLEDYRVLNESLRSRSNSRGLHMPLVCPDGAVVTYACKRQIAGQEHLLLTEPSKPAISATPLADCVLVYGASSAFEGLAANFDGSQSRTEHCVLQTDLDSDAFQRYSNLCALNVTPTLEVPSFDVQGSSSGRAKRVAQPFFLNMIFLSRSHYFPDSKLALMVPEMTK
nr:hypothetical protein [Tanacetum cinerariifolium]